MGLVGQKRGRTLIMNIKLVVIWTTYTIWTFFFNSGYIN